MENNIKKIIDLPINDFESFISNELSNLSSTEDIENCSKLDEDFTKSIIKNYRENKINKIIEK